MAAATITATQDVFPFGSDQTQRRVIQWGKFTFTASPATYTTGGFVPTYPVQINTSTPQSPIMVYVESVKGSGYTYLWNQTTGKVQIFTGAAAQSAATELTSGAAIPAAVSSDTIQYEAHFLKNL